MLYVFYGPDDFIAAEAIAAIRQQLPADALPFNSTTLDGKRLKLDELARACEAMPFLADRRVVVVTNALKHLKAGKPREEVRDYLPNVPAVCDLIFWEQGDLDKRNVVFTYLKKHGTVQECVPLQGAELHRWLADRAKHAHVKLPRTAAAHLIELSGNDSRTLVNELHKLAAYVGTGGTVTPDVIDLLIADRSESNLFAFIDSLASRQPAAALAGLRGLLDDGQAPAYIVFMLMRQVRILLGVAALQAERLRPDEIASQLRQKPFVVRKALEQLRSFRIEELEALHDRLLATDHAIKTGRQQADVALEMLVYEWSMPRATHR